MERIRERALIVLAPQKLSKNGVLSSSVVPFPSLNLYESILHKLQITLHFICPVYFGPILSYISQATALG